MYKQPKFTPLLRGTTCITPCNAGGGNTQNTRGGWNHGPGGGITLVLVNWNSLSTGLRPVGTWGYRAILPDAADAQGAATLEHTQDGNPPWQPSAQHVNMHVSVT